MAYAARMDNSRRLTTIAGVAAIHGLLGYVFISGMAASFVHKMVDPFTVTNIPIETPPPPLTPKPPTLEKVTPQQTTVAPPLTAVVPIITTHTVDPVVVVPPPPMTGTFGNGVVTVDPPVAPEAASKAAGVLARGDRNQWITTDDYPPSALRGEEQGVVGIALRIAADGRIDSCTVTASSGHVALDQATCRLYQRRARFTPARDDAGTPVAGTFTDRVRWQLPL
ncbi:energy transducer TonB [Sphingomonas phyllosphaerae]|uniref:energy transducer TonB n=1 Tax=Sphingomonas phyllosphaerae TaxID=257003 RepID=UPI0003B61BDE|nr:energy transducer TonB [Sphingomonas phyllosphaerae]